MDLCPRVHFLICRASMARPFFSHCNIFLISSFGVEQDTTQTRTYIASSWVSNIMYALGARSCACTPQPGNPFVSCVWAGAPPHGGADHVCFKHEAPCSVSPVSVCTNFSLERFGLTRFMLHAVHSFHVVHAVHDSSGSRFMGSHY